MVVGDRPLYLDYPSSSPPAEEVIEAMMPWLRQKHANPHAEHLPGRLAAEALESARASIAHLVGASPEEIFFTSGATESNNLALQGMFSSAQGLRTLAVSKIEHKSVLEVARFLSTKGVIVESVPTDQLGRISSSSIGMALASHSNATKVVAIGHGNNEIGTVQDIDAISKQVHIHNGLLHIDASQSVGKIALDVTASEIDTASLSSHKIYGPGGIGGLYVTSDLRQSITPLMYGGGQENGLRPGTVPVFLAVGFGAAARMAARQMYYDQHHLTNLAEVFRSEMLTLGIHHFLQGDPSSCLPGIVSIRLPGINASDLLSVVAPELSASTGASCMSGELRSSHVLSEIGLNELEASEVIRIGFGRETSASDAIAAAFVLKGGVQRILSR
jgi:cysteine desulfurase